MSARKEVSLKSAYIQKIGIIAGAGSIPQKLKAACAGMNIEPFVVGLDGNTDQIEPDYWAKIGQAGKIIQSLRAREVTDIVLIGAVKTPSLWNVCPDWVAFKFFWKCWLHSFGDNNMLQAARAELEKMGFKLHGVHDFLPELLASEGSIGKYEPDEAQWTDIQMGITHARALGQADIGQAVLVKNNKIIAQENKRGTSWMIKAYGEKDAILVKMCKPQQDRDLDLPTIGPETIKLCAHKNMAGIITHAGHSLLVEREKVRELADKSNLFITGVSLSDD